MSYKGLFLAIDDGQVDGMRTLLEASMKTNPYKWISSFAPGCESQLLGK